MGTTHCNALHLKIYQQREAVSEDEMHTFTGKWIHTCSQSVGNPFAEKYQPYKAPAKDKEINGAKLSFVNQHKKAGKRNNMSLAARTVYSQNQILPATGVGG